MPTFLIHALIEMLICVMIVGLLWLLVKKAPFDQSGEVKSYIKWFLLAILVVIFIYLFLIPFIR